MGILSKDTSFQKSSKDIPRTLDKPSRKTLFGADKKISKKLTCAR
jgi:hypothetical protein